MSKNHNKELQLNIILAVIGQIISLFINLISKNVLRSCLGLEYLGLQSIYSNFCDIFSFAFFGVGTAMLFNLYAPIAKGNQTALSSIYAFFNQICRRISLLTLLVGSVATLLVLTVINGNIGNLEIVITYTTYLLSIILYNRYLFRHYFIVANQRRYLVTIVLSVTDGVALIAELLVLKLTNSYELFLLCIVMKNIVINMTLGRYLKKHYAYLFEPSSKLPAAQQKSIYQNVKDLLIYKIGNILVNNTDHIITSAVITTFAAGCYSNYSFIVSGVHSLISSFFEAIVAKIGNIISTRSKAEQFDSFRIVSSINILIVAFTCSCLFWLMQDFVTLWMGADALLPFSITVIVTVNYYLNSIHQTIGAYRSSAGLFQKIKYVVIAKGILNLLLSFILGFWLGLFGILIATAISHLATMCWYEPYLIYGYFNKTVKNELAYQLLGISMTLVTILSSGFVLRLLSGDTWAAFFLKALVCALVSLCCLGLLVCIGWIMRRLWLKAKGVSP